MKEAQIGIDFGSSGCGIGFSFCNENKIFHTDIFGTRTDCKVPTEIILDDYGNTLCFGEKCYKYLRDKGLNSGHHFKKVKMNLYTNQVFIKSVNTKKAFELVTVIQKILESLKEAAIEHIRRSRPNIKESSIKWTVTIPTIWEESQKSKMMEACKSAGLIDYNTDTSLFFTLEPEAASLYCLRKSDIDPNHFEKGKNYIVCDLGGGTGDIVVHTIGNNKKVKEIEPSTGGIYGSNEINNKIFEDIIYKIFGFKDFVSLLNEYKLSDFREGEEGDKNLYGDWNDLEKDINEYKETANLDNYKSEYHAIKLNIFKDFFNDDLEDLIKKYNNSVPKECKLIISSKKKWIVNFPYKIIYNYITNQSKYISDKMSNILSKIKDIDTIIFVGGYCLNDILITSIKNNLLKQKSNLYFFVPPKPFLAVMEGSVIFGINPDLIYSRKAKYTIGTDARSFWNEEIHSKLGKKIYDEKTGKYRCKDCFSKFIEVEQNIELDQEITETFTMTGPRYCNIGFYASLKPNPIFIYEEGVDKIGECRLDAGKDYPDNEREISITMKYGGTKYLFKTKHISSGRELEVNFIYE